MSEGIAKVVNWMKQEEETTLFHAQEQKKRLNATLQWLQKAIKNAENFELTENGLFNDQELVAALQETEMRLREFQRWETALARVRQAFKWMREAVGGNQ